MNAFEKLLGKDNPLYLAIKERGFETPSEIQEKSIPEILKGKDVIAGASTGSGKTLAFAAGLIKNISSGKGLQGLVLTPTRELAEQVSKELKFFAKHKDLDVSAVYGGVGINPQIKKLESVEIVVATPGRLLDHIERNSIDLSRINTIVLDEADRMLDMGFRDDVKKIIRKCPIERQFMLFSATISPDVLHLIKDQIKNYVEISAEDYVDPKKLKQIYYDVRDNLKFSLLKYLLEKEKADLVMVFCNTRKNVDFIVNNLRSLGIDSLAIHGGITQDKRNKTMSVFHSKEVNILVATDVAARGLHIDGVSHIYNYDTPDEKKEYIHRIGRTARAGKDGKVINLISMRDYENFSRLLPKELGIVEEKTPFIEQVQVRWIPGRGRDSGKDKRFGVRDSLRYEKREREDGTRDAGRGRAHSSVRKESYNSPKKRSRQKPNRFEENRSSGFSRGRTSDRSSDKEYSRGRSSREDFGRNSGYSRENNNREYSRDGRSGLSRHEGRPMGNDGSRGSGFSRSKTSQEGFRGKTEKSGFRGSRGGRTSSRGKTSDRNSGVGLKKKFSKRY